MRDELAKIVFGAKLTKVNDSLDVLAEKVHNMTDEQMVDYIKRIAFKISGLGHDSILEMGRIYFDATFSRLGMEYLEHFRLNSFQERSLRLSRKIEILDGDKGAGRLSIKRYNELQKARITAEDARYNLLMGVSTNVAVNTNFRELFYMTSRLLRSDHVVGREVGQYLLSFVQGMGFDLEHCDDLVSIRGRDPKETFTPFGEIQGTPFEITDYEKFHQKPELRILGEHTSIPWYVDGHRNDEKTVYLISAVLSNVALAQLRRHRIGTLIIEKYHGNGISYEIDLEKGGFCYKSVEYGDPLNAPMGLLKGFTWVINKRSMDNFLRLRMDSHAQHEIREFATNLHQKIYS